MCVIAPQSWHWRKPSFMLFLSSGIWWSHIGQILYESCQEQLGHFMINVPYTLEFSQCSQGFSEWKVVDVSWLLLSVSSLSFSVSLSSSWVSSASLPFSEATSSSILLYRSLTLQVHLETYSAHEAWQLHTQLARRCLWRGIIRLFQSNCPRGVQKRISLEAAILCSKSEARFSDTAWERWLKTSFILGSSSSLSSPELSLSSCSLSCSSSTKSIFLFILMSTGGRRGFERPTLRCVTSSIALEILSLKQQGPISLE